MSNNYISTKYFSIDITRIYVGACPVEIIILKYYVSYAQAEYLL